MFQEKFIYWLEQVKSITVDEAVLLIFSLLREEFVNLLFSDEYDTTTKDELVLILAASNVRVSLFKNRGEPTSGERSAIPFLMSS